MLRGSADGVIVGSALVKKFAAISEGTLTREEALEEIGDFAAAMVEKTSKPVK